MVGGRYIHMQDSFQIVRCETYKLQSRWGKRFL